MTPMRTLTFLLFALLTAAAGSAQVLDVRELNTAQLRALDPARTAILLTGGILEEHGPYLPAYSDGYQTDFIASRLAEAIAARPGWSVLRFPDIPLGAMPANDIGGKFSFPGSYGVRSATLRAVYMDLATDFGEAGFKWVFALNYHGGPTHNQAMDDAGRYFADTFGGRMVNLTGLISVAGAVPADVFSPAERASEGYSVHADADEHSRVLFPRPDLVAPSYRSAAPVVGKDFPALVSLAGQTGWPGYFGTPAIANATAGDRAMRALAQAAIDAALKVLDGAPDARLPRVWGVESADPEVKPVIDLSLQHEQQIERRETKWLMRR